MQLLFREKEARVQTPVASHPAPQKRSGREEHKDVQQEPSFTETAWRGMAQGEQAELSIKPDALIKRSRFPPVGFMNLLGIQPTHPCLHHPRKAPGIPIRPDALPLITPKEGGCRRLRDFLWCVDQTLLSRRKRADADRGKAAQAVLWDSFPQSFACSPWAYPRTRCLSDYGFFLRAFCSSGPLLFHCAGYRVRGTTGVWNERGWDALLFREKEAKSFWEIPAESPHYGGLERFC